MTTKHSQPALPPEVDQAITEYSPKLASATLWSDHGELVLSRVRALRPQGVEAARRLLSAGAGILAFANDNHIPLQPETLFSDEVIERYIATGVKGRSGTRATLRSRLRRLQNASVPAQIPEISYRRVKPPYDRNELAGMWRMVSAQPSAKRKRRLQALYCLCLGAGCDSTDLRHVYGTSVRTTGDIVLVDIGGRRPRTVPVFAGLGETLIELAEETGQGLLIGGNPDHVQVVNALTASATGGDDLARLNPTRLRHSWMVALMSARIPLSQLASLAGIATLRVFEDLLPYCHLPADGCEAEASRQWSCRGSESHHPRAGRSPRRPVRVGRGTGDGPGLDRS